MSKPVKKKRSPKRVLALPDLERSEASVLSSLMSESGQVPMTTPQLTSSSGTAQNRVSRSTAPWFCGTGSQ